MNVRMKLENRIPPLKNLRLSRVSTVYNRMSDNLRFAKEQHTGSDEGFEQL